MSPEIRDYNDKQDNVDRQICDLLATTIDAVLTAAHSQIWHAHPVWFLDNNPIVGYSKQKSGWRLMFWSGASFAEPRLNVIGKKFKDASIFYTAAEQINATDLKRWLKKSISTQWDYKNIVKRKGRLELIAPAKKTEMMKDTSAHDERIANMTFSQVYPMYVAKVERKGRTQAELHQVIQWLTGFSAKKLEKLIKDNVTFKTFFEGADLNPNAHLITGVICGYRVEEIENSLTQKVRYLDKLVDELAKGRKMEKILRSA
jgi:hypothetical protein